MIRIRTLECNVDRMGSSAAGSMRKLQTFRDIPLVSPQHGTPRCSNAEGPNPFPPSRSANDMVERPTEHDRRRS